jgi:Ca2+/Na+ antiporter
MPEAKRHKERLIVLPLVGVIALNYPLLSLFSRVKLLFGVPVLYLYLFAVWLLFILGVAVILEKSGPPPEPGEAEPTKPGSG